MVATLQDYTRWLHTRWPAGSVERLPRVRPDGSTNVPGVYVVGDLTGVPLLKFSADTGARAVQTMVAGAAFQRPGNDNSNPDALINELLARELHAQTLDEGLRPGPGRVCRTRREHQRRWRGYLIGRRDQPAVAEGKVSQAGDD
ncbi:MAG: hypothetical protein IH988_11595 [Planctomycetes bacterium]|nr:hypothetical protein [Planctomycetota bacterium]